MALILALSFLRSFYIVMHSLIPSIGSSMYDAFTTQSTRYSNLPHVRGLDDNFRDFIFAPRCTSIV
jgi:hypothetical protein